MAEEGENYFSLESLNAEQKDAVLSNDKRLLILAGAGSGKTKTIIQKIIHLVFEKNIDPSNILAITFTKNAKNEMIDRLILFSDKKEAYRKIFYDKNLSQKTKDFHRIEYMKKYPWLSNLNIRTFHSLSYNLLRKYGSQEFDNRFKLIDDKIYDEEINLNFRAPETQKEIFHKVIKEICEDSEYLIKLKRYIVDYYIDEPRRRVFNKEHRNYGKPYTTLRGEQVRSKSERYIADWLYIHNIDYAYEPMLEIKDFEFRPDFFIPAADAYLEHVSELSENMRDKEKQFKIAGKPLIKTYEKDVKDIRSFYDILDNIFKQKMNIEIKKDIALGVESEFKTYFKQLDEFVLMVVSVIDKIKVENIAHEEIYNKARKDQHERIKIFYELAEPLIEKYNSHCIKKSYLDFNDLIIMAMKVLENNLAIRKAFQEKFKYILVDEFQDVNTLQVRLLNYLLTNENQLFCVGDDWQSIYGWRGAEVDYIINFKKYFYAPKIMKLKFNYRSNDTIVKASNEIIKNNKLRVDKDIDSINKDKRKIYLYSAKRENEDGVEIVFNKIQQLIQNGYYKEDILVLYRRTQAIEPYRERLRGLATLRTMHSAKGLEAKIVFIVGLNAGIYGFPQVWESDRILQIVKPSKYDFLVEEERRLFYVAITRAKEELFLISEIGNESRFIKEIPVEFVERKNFLLLNTKNKEINCNVCSMKILGSFNFCPHCGDKIIGENKEKTDIEI